MTLKAYWWDPRRPPRQLFGELANHGSAWRYLLKRRRRMQNFGDAVNAQVLEALTGRSVTWASLGTEDVVCIGSVLNVYSKSGGRGQILGSGVRDPVSLSKGSVPVDRLIGVRGHHSASALGLESTAAIGDPGLVISQIVATSPKTSAPLFVPHFAMPGTPSGRELLSNFRRSGFQVVLPNCPPEEVARAVSASSFVVSTSLHALVFADAYGVPCVKLDTPGDREPNFKYLDYRSIFGIGLASVSVETALSHNMFSDEVEMQHGVVRAGLSRVTDDIYKAARGLR